MKKVQEECPVCERETTHRRKRRAYKDSKKRGYITVNLPLKCMVCGYIHGQRVVRKKGPKKVMISLRE